MAPIEEGGSMIRPLPLTAPEVRDVLAGETTNNTGSI